MQLGCGEIDITPHFPINLGGYGARKFPAKGVASNLYARGFLFEHEGLRTGLITADLIMLNREQVRKVQAEASRLTGVSPDNIVISCSHTHSGPSTFTLTGLGNPPDPDYINWLLKALAGTLVLAENNLEPVRVGSASTTIQGLSSNRRDPGYPVDRELIVLGFQDNSAKLKALLFNFPCHPTVLGADNLLVSAEYPGAAVAAIKKLYPKTVTAFINGACGDISARFLRRSQTHEEVQRLGIILGGNIAALAASLSFSADHLAAHNLTVPIQHKEVPEPALITAEIQRWQGQLQELKEKGAPAAELRLAQTGLEGAMIQREYAKVRDSLETEAHLSVWKLGPVGLVTMPGELFSSLGQKIKGESPFPATIVAGYSNGYIGYIPDQEAYEQGGYETLSSPLLMGFGEDLAAAAVDGLREVTNKQR